MAGLSKRSVIIICMLKCVSLWTVTNTPLLIALCKAPRFSSSLSSNSVPPLAARICAACQGSEKGSRRLYVDRNNLLSTLLHRLQSQCVSHMTITLSSDVLFPPGSWR